MASDQYETGLSIRKEVLGDEYVDAAIAKARDGGVVIERFVESDDAAKGPGGIGGEGALVCGF